MSLRFQFFVIFCLTAMVVSAMRFDEYTFRGIDARHGLSDNRVQHIMSLDDGRMAITTEGNINIFDGSTFRYVHHSTTGNYRLPDYNGAYHVYSGDDGMIWIKFYKSLQCFNLKTFSYIHDIDSLLSTMRPHGSGEVRDFFVDKNHGAWIITGGSAIDVSRQAMIPLPLSSGLLQDMETHGDRVAFFYDNGEAVVVARDSGEESMRITAFDVNEDKSRFSGTSLVKPGKGDVMYQIRTGYGGSVLLRLDLSSGAVSELLRLPYVLHTLVTDGSGTVYITSSEGVWTVDETAGDVELVTEIKSIDGNISLRGMNTISFDYLGGMWLGSYHDGVITGNRRRHYMESRDALPESLVREEDDAMTGAGEISDCRGLKWIATADGLRVIRGDTVAMLYTDDGLSNNNIKSIIEDRNGDIWVTTSYGISRIAVGKGGQYEITGFTDDDGAMAGEYLPGRLLRFPDGMIAAGGHSGWTTFHPDSMTFADVALSPLITGVWVNGTRLNALTNERLRLEYWQNSLSVDVSSLNYVDPRHTVFRSRLLSDSAPADTAWIIHYSSAAGSAADKTGVLHLSFLHQPPGEYRLQVTAASSPGAEESAVTELHFAISPPWWKSTAAKAFYICLAIAVIVAGAVLYQRVTRRRIERNHREEMLLMRIKSLIERCDFYENQVSTNNLQETREDTGLNEEERGFINRAMELVEKNIATRGYNVEQLSRDLCMERTGLYKKMTMLLDKTPSAFIKSIRLNRAAALVKEGKMSIAEIAELTGFSSASYLSRCFSEQWGCTPSEYYTRNQQN